MQHPGTNRALGTARRIDPTQCRSGDGCPRPRADGSDFCATHADELARIRRAFAADEPR